MMLDNDVNKDNKDKKEVEEYWEPCPRCESNRVKKISKTSIFAQLWFIIIPLAIFLPFIGVPFLIAFGLITLYGFIKNRHMLKCKDCDKQWAYEDTNST